MAALRNIRPFIATPSYSGAVTSLYVGSLLGLVNLAWQHGLAMQVRFLDGDSLVTRARNRLVASFMADARWTHLFWIDADIGFAPAAALRLLLSGHDVAAGVYPLKSDGWPEGGIVEPLPAGSTRADFEARHARFPANALAGSGGDNGNGNGNGNGSVDADGFMEVLDAPTGFMLIARKVFERLAVAYPELRYTPDALGSSAQEAALPHWRFFDVMAEPDNGRYLTEDYAFCRRWQAIGGHIHIDARSNLAHQGLRTYTGDFARTAGALGGG